MPPTKTKPNDTTHAQTYNKRRQRSGALMLPDPIPEAYPGWLADASSPLFALATFAFQADAGLQRDGLYGPTTQREALTRFAASPYPEASGVTTVGAVTTAIGVTAAMVAGLFSAPVAPPTFREMVGVRDHIAPPETFEDALTEVRRYKDWGWTDVFAGVTNAIGKHARLLGGDTDAEALRLWALFAKACRREGLRFHASFWHKPSWHKALVGMTERFSNALADLCTSVVWDMEGETFGVHATWSILKGVKDIMAMKKRLRCPWGITHIPHHSAKARPIIRLAAWSLLQVLSHENEAKGMGLTNAWTLPGLWHEEILDKLRDSWSWMEEGGRRVVLLVAAYRQDWEGVDAEDAVGTALSSILADGRRQAGVFSALWLAREEGIQRELVRRVFRVEPKQIAGAANNDIESIEDALLAAEAENDDAEWGDVLTSGSVYEKFTGDEAESMYAHLKGTTESLGFTWDERALAVNPVGVRSAKRVPDAYDDRLFLCWRERDGSAVVESFAFNCDPSSRYLTSPVRMARARGGTAALVHPQQVLGMFVGLHMGKTLGLVQWRKSEKAQVWRVDYKGGVLDYISSPTDTGWFGINWHKGGFNTTGSAGCQTWPPAVHARVKRTLLQHRRAAGNRINPVIVGEEHIYGYNPQQRMAA